MMLDTDAVLDVFFQTCFEAGPERCAFYDSSPSKISANFDALHERLRIAPLPVFVNETSYSILDYSTARSYARLSLFTTYADFPAYAEALAQLQQGNGSVLYALAGTPNTFSCDCANAANPDNTISEFTAHHLQRRHSPKQDV